MLISVSRGIQQAIFHSTSHIPVLLNLALKLSTNFSYLQDLLDPLLRRNRPFAQLRRDSLPTLNP
ncbi:hypothetical protein CEP51_013302, partial [Fusarium floridanum]